MRIIGQLINPNQKFKIMMSALIIFVFFIGILPIDKPDVIALEPDKSQFVYLPLVSKNSLTSCSEGSDQWLCLINFYRATTGVNPVVQNNTYNSTMAFHTNYMLLNPTQDNMHTEYLGKPGYTEAGKEAASQSNMIKLIGDTYLTTKQSIDLWMATPNHRYNMLHPDLTQSGFSLQCDTKNCFSGLNILGSLPASYKIREINLVYPADKQQGIPTSRYPITWGFYMPWSSTTSDKDEVRFISATIKDKNNRSIAYTKQEPNHTDGSWAYNNQVVITPGVDLLPEQTYWVEMAVSFQGKPYSRSWSFTTAP